MAGRQGDPSGREPLVRRWLHVLALVLAWGGGTGTVAGLAFAGVGAAAGRDDPHGGGLPWAIGTGVLPWALGLLACALLAWATTRPRPTHRPRAG